MDRQQPSPSVTNMAWFVSFFGEQFIPQLFSFFFAGIFLGIVFEPKIVAVVGPVFFFHIFGLRFSTFIGLCLVVEYTVQADMKIRAA